MSDKDIEMWDEYWDVKNPLYKSLSKIYRKYIMAPTVKKYYDGYFPNKGIFLEAGSGTSEISMTVSKKKRIFISLDINEKVLKFIKNPKTDFKIKGDILKLPFRSNTIDGIFNAGVMEHFNLKELEIILKEFERVLKYDGYIILFWPWEYSITTTLFRTKVISDIIFKNIPFDLLYAPSNLGKIPFTRLINKLDTLKIKKIDFDLLLNKIIILKKCKI